MRNFKNFIAVAMALCLAVGCCNKASYVGVRTEALDASAWESSKWISVVDAPVVPKDVFSTRSADGANWFLTTIANEQRVVSAKWMTAGLGVYELYLNGKIVGNEIIQITGSTKTLINVKIAETSPIPNAENTEERYTLSHITR